MSSRSDSVSLKEFFNHRFDELEQRLDIRQKSNENSLDIASDELNRRLEGMNEFRKSLTDQTNTFLTREIWDREHRNLSEKIDQITLWRASLEGARSRANIISMVAVVISLLASLLHFVK